MSTHWNHRVVKHQDNHAIWYQIHEVYYTDDKPIGITQDAIAPLGETLEELKEELARMLKACDTPILDYNKDFPS